MRVNAIQELENIVATKENFNDVMPFMAVFIRFLNKLLEDNNFKVSISAMNIIKDIICVQGVSQQSNLASILPICIKKLGDNKIAVRQSTFKVFMSLFRNSKNRTIASAIMPQLNDALSSSNWHIREEVVIIILACMLDGVEFDYLYFVPQLAKLLDDSKTKIRYVTTEALAVLASKNQEELVLTLKPIVDETAMASLMQRFQMKALPVLNDDYVEFPKAFPNSAPVISSPYITGNTFLSPFNTTSEIQGVLVGEVYTPSTLNSSLSPITNIKPKRLRPSSESNFNTDEPAKSQKKVFVLKNSEKPGKQSYQTRYILKQNKEKSSSPKMKIKDQLSKFSDSSPTIPKKGFNQNDDQPTYLAVEELKKVQNPDEALQKCLVSGNLDN